MTVWCAFFKSTTWKMTTICKLCDREMFHDLCGQGVDSQETTSDAFLAEILLRSPGKIFIFVIKFYIFWIKVSKKIFFLIVKKASTRRPNFKGVATLCKLNWQGSTRLDPWSALLKFWLRVGVGGRTVYNASKWYCLCVTTMQCGRNRTVQIGWNADTRRGKSRFCSSCHFDPVTVVQLAFIRNTQTR